ncbi:unnamed protein product [Closterium sp. NIES-65]|nr:unnamed protein product [Closterium sp. NIES-65]
MEQIPAVASTSAEAMYRDVVHRRWARAFLFHLLSIGPFLFLWAAPLVVRAGLLPSLLSFFSLRLYLAFAIFDLSQLLFVLAHHAIVVADAPPLPSTASLLSSAANLAGFAGISDPRPFVHQDQQIRASHDGFRGPASQWEAEAARATLAGRAKFASLCAAAGAAGAIALSLFRAQLLRSTAETESNDEWPPDGWAVAGEAGFGGAVGVLFAAYHVVRRDYLLAFPVLQRAPFYRFKTTLPRCATSAATFGCITALLYSLLLRPLLLPLLATATTTATGIPLTFLAAPPLSIRALLLSLLARLHGVAFLAFSWEAAAAATNIFLTHRHLFLPAPSSPSSPLAPLLLALSPSPGPATPPSPVPLPLLALPRLVLHWALLDLSLLAESEADTWRRAVLFESQEAYSAVVAACIRPIDAMTARVAAAAGYPTVTTALQQQQQQHYSLQSPTAAFTAAGFASAEGMRWRQGKGGGEGVEGQALQGGGVLGSGAYGSGMGVGGVEGRRRAPSAAEVFFDWQVSGRQVSGRQVSGRQVSGRQVSGRQVSGRQVSGRQVSGRQVSGQPVRGRQLCVMSMRALAALTAASRGEDRMGVAQMAGANAAALSALLSALLALDSLLLSPSHRHPAAPATFSGFGEASSQATPPGASQPAFSHQTSVLASGSEGLFGTPTLGLRGLTPMLHLLRPSPHLLPSTPSFRLNLTFSLHFPRGFSLPLALLYPLGPLPAALLQPLAPRLEVRVAAPRIADVMTAEVRVLGEPAEHLLRRHRKADGQVRGSVAWQHPRGAQRKHSNRSFFATPACPLKPHNAECVRPSPFTPHLPPPSPPSPLTSLPPHLPPPSPPSPLTSLPPHLPPPSPPSPPHLPHPSPSPPSPLTSLPPHLPPPSPPSPLTSLPLTSLPPHLPPPSPPSPLTSLPPHLPPPSPPSPLTSLPPHLPHPSPPSPSPPSPLTSLPPHLPPPSPPSPLTSLPPHLPPPSPPSPLTSLPPHLPPPSPPSPLTSLPPHLRPLVRGRLLSGVQAGGAARDAVEVGDVLVQGGVVAR